MRTLHVFWLSLLAVSWLGCSTVMPPAQQAGTRRRGRSAKRPMKTSASRSSAWVTRAASTAARTCPVKSSWRSSHLDAPRPPPLRRGVGRGGIGAARRSFHGGPSWSSPTGTAVPNSSSPLHASSHPGARRSTTSFRRPKSLHGGSRDRASRFITSPCRFRETSTGGFMAATGVAGRGTRPGASSGSRSQMPPLPRSTSTRENSFIASSSSVVPSSPTIPAQEREDG